MKEEVLCLKHQSIVILRNMLIFVSKASKYNDEALTYAKKLIKANYNKATDAEIEKLLKEAKDKSSSGKTAYNGKGISYYRTRSYSSNNSSFLFYLEVISYH